MAAIDADYRALVVSARRLDDWERALEQAMPPELTALGAEPEHRSAETDRALHVPVRFFNVLDTIRDTRRLQELAHRRDQERRAHGAFGEAHDGVSLTGRAGPDEVVSAQLVDAKRQRISNPHIPAWPPPLLDDINAIDIEPGAAEPSGHASGAAKEIERFHHSSGILSSAARG
jgi:hypothetical protein